MANVLRKAAEVAGSMRRCLVSHSARRGPTFNTCLSAGMDPRSILHVNLWPVPGFSGGVKVFCYTGISSSEPPTPADAEETICKAFHLNSHTNKHDRSTQPTSAVVPTYRVDSGPVRGISAGYESDNSWDFSDSGEADCSHAPRTTTLLAYTSYRGRPNRGWEQNYGRGNSIAVRGGSTPHSRP